MVEQCKNVSHTNYSTLQCKIELVPLTKQISHLLTISLLQFWFALQYIIFILKFCPPIRLFVFEHATLALQTFITTFFVEMLPLESTPSKARIVFHRFQELFFHRFKDFFSLFCLPTGFLLVSGPTAR